MTEVIDIPTDQIKPQALQRPVSPQGIDELARSIKTLGVLEPLLLVQHQDVYHLIAGQRRLLAAQQVGLATVPCIIVPADQEKALQISLHENLFRENLTPHDEAILYAYLRDHLKYTNRAIAKMLSKSEPYVSQRLALLTWDPIIIDGIKDGSLCFSVARELMQVKDMKHRRYLARHAIDEGINYRTARTWVQQWKMSLVPPPSTGEAEPVPPGPELRTEVVSTCYWCDKGIPIEKVVVVHYCEVCFDDLEKVREKSRKG